MLRDRSLSERDLDGTNHFWAVIRDGLPPRPSRRDAQDAMKMRCAMLFGTLAQTFAQVRTCGGAGKNPSINARR